MGRKKSDPLQPKVCKSCGSTDFTIIRGPFSNGRAAKEVCSNKKCATMSRWVSKEELSSIQFPIDTEFTILIDSREIDPFTFEGLEANADQGRCPLIVKTKKAGLAVGDYSILENQQIIIERKSKEDLFQSVTKRDNFEDRLERMDAYYAFAAVVIESEESDIRENPPPFTEMTSKSVLRSIMAWRQRYVNVHWIFCADRVVAEATTFRMLERFYLDAKFEKLSYFQLGLRAQREGIEARLNGEPVSSCQYETKSTLFQCWEEGWKYCDVDIVQRDSIEKQIHICNGTCYRFMSSGKQVMKKG